MNGMARSDLDLCERPTQLMLITGTSIALRAVPLGVIEVVQQVETR